jgi:hypothetical protein
VKIEFDSKDQREVSAIHELTRSLLGITSQPVAAAPAPAKPPKAAATPAPAAVETPAAPTPTPTPEPAPVGAVSAPAGDAPVADFAAASTAFQTFVKANGPANAKPKLAAFGVSALKDLTADQFGPFIASLAA